MSTSATATEREEVPPPPPPPPPHPPPRRACEECNRKKAKCDMRRPVCGPCLRSGTSCQFPSRRKRPTPRKPRLKSQSRWLADNLPKLLQALDAATRTSGDGASTAATLDFSESLHRDLLQGFLLEVEVGDGQNAEASVTGELNDNARLLPPNRQVEDAEQDVHGADIHQSDAAANHSNHDPPYAEPGALSTTQAGNNKITSSLALELINLFFENIQPWLPLLNKPRFLARMEEKLRDDGDILEGLDPDETLTLSSIFALSARFSSHPIFADVPTLERGDEFAEKAAKAFEKGRLSVDAPFAHLQGCILLAFYMYTSRPTQQVWVLIGVCVRLAYFMGLSDLDDAEWVPTPPVEMVEKEELRRAWWLVWELDSVASITFRKPFSIDRRRIAVKLPISDTVWFAGGEVDSAKMITNPSQAWRSLQGSANQDPRAWFLLAHHFMSCVFDRLQQREELTLEDKLMLENEVACFKMVLPSVFRLDSEPMDFSTSTFARCNWIIGIHLILMTSSFMISAITTNEPDEHSPASQGANSSFALRQRAIHLSRVISQWDTKYIHLAHPLLSYLIVAPFAKSNTTFQAHPLILSSHNLAQVVLSKFAVKWKVARIVQRLLDAVERDVPLSEVEKTIARSYEAFFPFSPFIAANTPSETHGRERSVSSPAEGIQHIRNLNKPMSSQDQPPVFPLPGDLLPPDSLPEHINATSYQDTSFEACDLPQHTYDSGTDNDCGIFNFLGTYQDTDLLPLNLY